MDGIHHVPYCTGTSSAGTARLALGLGAGLDRQQSAVYNPWGTLALAGLRERGYGRRSPPQSWIQPWLAADEDR